MKRGLAATAVSAWIHKKLGAALRHPKYRWWVITGSLVYLLNPLDMMPDALPVVGWIDDSLLATLVVAEVAQVVGDRRKAQRQLKQQVQPPIKPIKSTLKSV